MAATGCDALTNGLSCYSTYVREPSNYDQAYVSSCENESGALNNVDPRRVTVRNKVLEGFQFDGTIIVHWSSREE